MPGTVPGMPAVPASARRPLALLLILSACVALGSCGGGADTVTSDTPPTTPPPPTGATGGLDSRPSNTTCLATVEPGFGVSVSATRVFPNLTFQSPTLLLQAPGDDTKWYVLQKNGVVLTFANSNATTSASTFVDLRDRVMPTDEGGLLGMAFDPNYATNQRVYLSYTANPTVGGSVLESRISRFSMVGAALNPGSESILLTLAQPYTNHKGGNIAFGPDNLLYAGFGDGGSGGDPQNRSQNRSVLFGKIIRVDVSGGGAYTVPAGNPFANGGARCQTGETSGGALCSEIYAYGFRNPWRWSFDKASQTPDMWVGDVGQNAWEEVDRVQAGGGNYGWRLREGAHCYNPSTNCTMSADGSPLIEPVAEYSHSLGISITGGYVYRGTAIPSLLGRYIFGDFGSGTIFALLPDAAGALQVKQILSTGASISSFGQGNDGELYYVDYGGTLHKIVPDVAQGSPIKALLSQTGCMNPANPTQPAAGLIPYTPVAQFWSDGATKSRWMALPDNTKITVEADGDWTFPSGTVLVKNFTLNGQLIETRLFMRHTDSGNWGGYTYRWNSTHTDASLVSGGLTETIGTQDWTYPSEAQCLQCHTSGAGRSLGLETRQLNSSVTYPATGRSANQLTTLQGIGLFANTLTVQDAYPDPADTTQSTTNRARSYLHTNCAQCHRPNGGTPVSLDLRYSTALASTNTCNATPASGDLGVAGARVVTPGDASKSVLYLRMSRRDANRMPPVASHLVDTQGATLLQQWINGMGAGCL
ncbi:MAG: PQQ-dependent sugar dehydrogenase [Gammaproteobacteria bacterium]